ncbi:hypothetical protein O9K51_09591 [Purpureocillium lavendulum]|uniref:Uncharacterized protein n=1 Tax=Purpureocillium lavendulum TaxID=1247861 RepID=A0AB34FFF2_9HYPO|nr:hypothetical protein O9K51_09591 [Purpureocillium lavendulum]
MTSWSTFYLAMVCWPAGGLIVFEPQLRHAQPTTTHTTVIDSSTSNVSSSSKTPAPCRRDASNATIMVTLAALSAAAAAALTGTPLVAAGPNCNAYVLHCGQSLLNKGGGFFHSMIRELRSRGLPSDGVHIRHSLFACMGGDGYQLAHVAYCRRGCLAGGTPGSDICKP